MNSCTTTNPIHSHWGELSQSYLDQIEATLSKAMNCHPRTLAVRVDLRFPACPLRTDPAVISRFIESLKAHIQADLKAKSDRGCRVHPCQLRYVWVREQDSGVHQHYHVLLLFNRDTYNCLGNYDALGGNLAFRIRSAWASAIGVSVDCLGGAVYFPDNPIYHLNRNAVDYPVAYEALYYRVSYFSKLKTKHYGGGIRHFGCSII